ncbi:hypothetical protein SAMN02745181_2232 [Rubritalea squalenifaciens DSM 18772]|uniref:Uncharacterized protein n=1 Tax=Rubritalea squalenifaciens DSM 18772 TaxID=1123071 RepID=A0A1M6KXN3_9BACT|nr:hypothetical protein [Rubritalea squalenifaciens]SHJ63654.1 hypothetical protein SAMN02745181_2232 [Rubritalea squalenifaciens DSM 18772]
MPYIDTDRRPAIDAGDAPQNAGELNYAISKLVDAYLIQKGGLRYTHINEVVGVLECAKLEVYRRLAAPYEDSKIAESGDVYEVLK